MWFRTTKKKKIKSFISCGSDIAGTAIGGALGFFSAGPGGAAAAGVLGVVASKIICDVANRHLSERERVRAGATAAFALTKIKKLMQDGYQPRSDGFLLSVDNRRPKAEELFEGVLLKTKNDHEEKKVKFIANIFANVVFRTDISIEEANYMLKTLNFITYRQLCFLGVTASNSKTVNGLGLRYQAAPLIRYSDGAPLEQQAILVELFELINLDLISGLQEKKQQIGEMNMREYIDLNPPNKFNIIPANLKLTKLGEKFCEVIDINELLPSDFDAVKNLLI